MERELEPPPRPTAQPGRWVYLGTQEPSGESQSRAPFLFSGPQMAGPTWPQLAARSLQLGASTQHTASRARPLAHSPQFCSSCSRRRKEQKKKQKKHPSTRARRAQEELSEATRTPVSSQPSSGSWLLDHCHHIPFHPTNGPPGQPPVWAFQSDLWHRTKQMRLMPAGSQQCPLPTRQSRAQFPGVWSLGPILVLAFGFSRLVLLLTLTAVHGPVVCSGRLRPLRL